MRGVRFGIWAVGCVVLLMASGCATMSKGAKTENENLKIQIQNLEAQLQQKNAEIDSLRQSLSRTTEEKYTQARSRQTVTGQPTVKQIQTALKNAGFDPGSTDGQMGRKTLQAVRDFQKANDLSVDGKVGKRTWAVLSLYLER